MHVLFTSTRIRQWNGLCKVTHTLAAELLNRGHTVTWFVAEDDQVPDWVDNRIKFLVNSRKNPAGWDALPEHVSQLQPDVVHSQGSANAKLQAVDAPVVVTSHDNWPHSWILSWQIAARNLVAQLRRQQVLCSADQVVGVSEYKKRWLRRRGISAKRVYNGIQMPSSSLREGAGFLAAGTVDSRKFGALPEIWRELHTQMDDTLDVVGKVVDGELASELRALPRCEVHGEVESLTPFYESHQILLNPTKLDCFGLVPVEAQARGMSVVAWNRTAMPEVVSPDTGALIPYGNVERFVQAARGIKSDADPDTSRRWVEERFTAHRMAAEYLSVYQSIT